MANAAQAVITISISGLASSDTFTVTASGSGTSSAFGVSSGTISEPANGNFVNNTQTYGIPVEGGSTLMATTTGSSAEQAITSLNLNFEPSELFLLGGDGPMGHPFSATPVTVSASGTATFIIPGGSPEATFGELFNTGTYSKTSNGVTYDYIINAIPEPSTFAALAGLAVIALAVTHRKRQRTVAPK